MIIITTIIISVLIMMWAVGGAFWAIRNGIDPDDVDQYTFGTNFIGGPGWWIMYFTNWIGKISAPSNRIKPKRK